MASLKKRPNGKWRARWYDLAGKEHSKHFDRKTDGKDFLATIEADKLRGQYVDPTDKTTVAAYAWRWAATRPHNRRTARRIASVIKNHVEETSLGDQRLSRVLPSEAQAWATERARLLAPSTAANVVYTVRSIFNAAVLDRLVGTSPFARKVSMPQAQPTRLVPLTVVQVCALADAMPARCRAMVIVQAGLGLRIGELLALRVQDVDFLRRLVRVATQIPPDEKEREDPKTPLSKRTLPAPQFVCDALALHIRDFPPLADGSLFYNSVKRLWSTSYFATKVFKPAVLAAGLPDTTTSHDLRHHYASVLLHAGESVVAVAERLGHRNANLVIKTYGHLMPDSEERTRAALEAAWRDPDQKRTGGSREAV